MLTGTPPDHPLSAAEIRFSIGDHVLYRQGGICLISEIRSEDFGTGATDYYFLRSIFNERSVFYVPVGAEYKLRKVLSPSEIDEAIARSKSITHEWIDDTKKRSAAFEEILVEGDRGSIISLIRMINQKKTELENNKKKMYASDLRLLSSAMKFVSEEFSFVLGIEKDSVESYIAERITI